MHWSVRVIRSLALIASLSTAAACARQDQQLQQHKEAFASLGATLDAIGDAWLSGSVSGTYTITALTQTLQLVEQERTALTASADALIDARGAQLSQSAERLSRLCALLIQDVRAADAAAARRHLVAIPIRPDPVERP